MEEGKKREEREEKMLVLYTLIPKEDDVKVCVAKLCWKCSKVPSPTDCVLVRDLQATVNAIQWEMSVEEVKVSKYDDLCACLSVSMLTDKQRSKLRTGQSFFSELPNPIRR